jgi:hypothetical protein
MVILGEYGTCKRGNLVGNLLVIGDKPSKGIVEP